MMVQFSRVLRKRISQFIKIKQDHHIEWDEVNAINRWLLMEVLCELLNFVWLIWQCLFNIMLSFSFSEAQDVYSDGGLFTKVF